MSYTHVVREGDTAFCGRDPYFQVPGDKYAGGPFINADAGEPVTCPECCSAVEKTLADLHAVTLDPQP